MVTTELLAAAVATVLAAGPAIAAGPCGELTPGAVANERARLVTAEDLASLRDIGGVALSPDGARLAFEILRADPATNTSCSAMFVMPTDGRASPKMVDAGEEMITDRYTNFGMMEFPAGAPVANTPKWSPDGAWIAYLKRVGGVDQLWRAATDGSSAWPVVTEDVDVEDFAWSQDASELVFATRPGLLAFREATAEEGLRGWLYDERFAPGVRRAPFARDIPVVFRVIDIRSGRVRDADVSHVAKIQPSPPVVAFGANVWAETAKGDVAWVSGSTPLDGELGVVIDGEKQQCEASACRGRITTVLWLGDGLEVGFVRREGWADSQTAFYRWPVGLSDPIRVFATDDLLEDCSLWREELICSHEASTIPRRIVAISLGNGTTRVVLDANPEFQGIALQPAERLHWRNALGLEVYGDLVLPAGHKAGQRHPLIIVGYTTRGFLRGGVGDEYPIQVFAANGFAVLSYARPIDVGYSTPTGDQSRDLAAGFAGWADRRSVHSALETGLDLAIGKGVIDPARVGITGLSDGSVTAQWALINSDRYSAASISSLNSQAGFLAIGGPARSSAFRGWGLLGIADPNGRDFWSAASIAENPRKVEAPLLVQVADDELLSGVDSFQALRELGRAVELYVFPGEHHIKWQPAHRLAIYRRNLQWFDFWLNGIEADEPLDPDQHRRWGRLREQALAN